MQVPSVDRKALKRKLDLKRNLEISRRKPKKAMQMRKKQQALLIEFLTKHYPLVFDKDSPRPLKIGVLKDLIKITVCYGFSALDTRRAIYSWTNRFEYHNSVVDNTHRFNLDGQPVKSISEEHKKYASDIIVKTLNNNKKNKKASRKRH